jgi:hypothetical protein
MISFELKPGKLRIISEDGIKKVPLVDLLHTFFKFTILYLKLLILIR